MRASTNQSDQAAEVVNLSFGERLILTARQCQSNDATPAVGSQRRAVSKIVSGIRSVPRVCWKLRDAEADWLQDGPHRASKCPRYMK